MNGALSGIRVVDLTDDSGRFAAKLLTELGADVLRVTDAGSPGHPLADPAAAAVGGVLDWWYDGGKRRHVVDLDTAAGRDAYRRLVAVADVVVDTERPGRLADLGVDFADLAPECPQLVQVSITPYGRTGPRAGWVASDLTAASMGGMLSLTGLPDRPLSVWGRQAYNYAGYVAATCAVSGVTAARRTGAGAHVDLSIHEVVSGSLENLAMQYFFADHLPLPAVAPRQGALHWIRAYDLAPCAAGHVMITPTPTPDLLFEWMAETGFEEVRPWIGLDPTEVLAVVDDVMDALRRWVAPFDARELWWEAQSRHVAFGGVLDVAEVCANPQFAHRGLFAQAAVPGAEPGAPDAAAEPAAAVTLPWRVVRWSSQGTAGAVAPGPPATVDEPLEDVLAQWPPRPAVAVTPTAPGTDPTGPDRRPLDGVRIVDFTWVLAGPSATKLLGDLGADVVRVQNEESSTIVNNPEFPYYFVWNRSKRSATLDMKHPGALAAARRLIERCDVLIENFSAGVLDSWGLDHETVRSWNPRLVYVSMSGCGHDGPWSHVISYAPTVHAVCGITHLTNFADRADVGPGFSLTDHLSGFAAALTTVAALAARDRTGEGQRVDMAQLEVGAYAVGPAIVQQLCGVTAPAPAGNVDGLADHVPNEVYRCADGEFVAVTATDDRQWAALAGALDDDRLRTAGLATEPERREQRELVDAALADWAAARSAADAMAQLQAVAVPAGVVQNADHLVRHDPQHAARGYWQAVEHGFFGARTVDAFAALWNGERWRPRHLAPQYLGEHNFDVWTELAGYTTAEVAELTGDRLFA